MTPSPPFRLSWKLLGAILPLVVVAVSVIVWLQYAAARREILGAINRESRSLSQRAAQNIDEMLRQRRRDLLTLSESPLIADYYHNMDFKLFNEAESYRAELERYLLNFARRARIYPEILFLDGRGQEVIHIRNGTTAPRGDASRSVYLAEARRLGSEDWWSSEIVDHPAVGEAQYYVKAARDETGELKGALVLIYDFSHLAELLRDSELGRRARSYIRTPARSYPSRPLGPSAEETLVGQTVLQERPWTVVVEAPLEQSLRPLRSVRNAALFTAMVGLAGLIAVLFFSVRSITRPIAKLVQAAGRLGEGDLGHRINEVGTDEIGTLSAAFNEMAERLESNRRKNQELQSQLIQAEKVAAAGLLLSSVAHELSNPLAVVAGHAQLLKYRDFPPAVHKILEQIRENAMRCGQVVSNMLLFVRSSRDTRKPVMIDKVIGSALDLLRYRLTKGDDVTVTVESDPALPEVTGDFQQLSQVLVNLISNARDAMEPMDPRVRKRELLVRTHAGIDWLTVEIKDNGPGIAQELGERIFEPFVTTKEPGRGTGLGLYICRQIVEAHQGTLTFESVAAEGATFRLRLPLNPSTEPASKNPSAEPSAVPGKRILVVDDEPEVAGVIVHALAEEGDELMLVGQGAEAIERLERENFDLVITDIEMQGTKGYDVYRSARSRSAGAIPVLIVTGNSLDRRVLKFFDETSAPYVIKPFDTEYLRRAVRRLLAGQPVSGLQTQ